MVFMSSVSCSSKLIKSNEGIIKPLIYSPIQDTNSMAQGPILMTLFNLITLLKALPPNVATLGLGHQHMNGEGREEHKHPYKTTKYTNNT